jgi:hypothetical protein
MKTSKMNLKILLLTIVLLAVDSGCYGSQGTAEDVNLPGDPYLVVETFTPTPDPLITGTLHIDREIIIPGGAGSKLLIDYQLPLNLLYRDNIYVGDDLVWTEGQTKGTLIVFTEGTIGSGDITATMEVTSKARGILHPYPNCEIELFIEEVWGDQAEMTATINGQEIITTVALLDLAPIINPDTVGNHVTIPKGQTELVEYVDQEGQVQWFNTYRVELLDVPKRFGCFK